MKYKRSILLISMVIYMMTGCQNNRQEQPLLTQKVEEKEQTNVSLEAKSEHHYIKITFEGKEVIAQLYDTEISRQIINQLPTTLTFKDFAQKEKITYLQTALDLNASGIGFHPEIGDIAVYLPWGNIVFFYGDQPYSDDLRSIGKVEQGLYELSRMDHSFEGYVEELP